MSKLTVLRNAIEKLVVAETALHEARRAFYTSKDDPGDWNYKRIDEQFENVGDAQTVLENILSVEEKKALEAE